MSYSAFDGLVVGADWERLLDVTLFCNRIDANAYGIGVKITIRTFLYAIRDVHVDSDIAEGVFRFVEHEFLRHQTLAHRLLGA